MDDIKKKRDRAYYYKNREKILSKIKSIYKTGKRFVCKQCGKPFKRRVYSSIAANTKFCSSKCQYDDFKVSRKGKNNPAYRTGDRVDGKNSENTGKRKLSAYRQRFVEKNKGVMCERCGKLKAFRFEVHHIFYRSEKPKHENLHKEDNLILLCIGCHNHLHSHKKEREKLVKFKQAKALFYDIKRMV